MIIWFSGISGSGKTTLANFYKKNFKKNFKKNLIHIDGDKFRDLFNNDLKYTLKDRNKNAKRLTKFVKFLSDQKLNLIISANLTEDKYRIWCKKNLKNYIHIFINASIKSLKKRDYKNLYKGSLQKKTKNVVGIDIEFKKPKIFDLAISNNESKKKFLSNVKRIEKIIQQKNLKIY